ncbi:MAG: MBL fold metallo-hydrolase [Woeseiaceae bacterium]|nr:MBL fold metallo-hydrolase [Woeseiaceae bacterium]
MTTPEVRAFFDEATFTVTYVVADADARRCAIVDSVLDFDQASGRTSTQSADEVLDWIAKREFSVDWILETHVHADHLSAAPYLAEKTGGKIGIGRHVIEVQGTFREVYNVDCAADGSQFDRLFDDGDTFSIGGIEGRVMHTPGHTPACIAYVIGDAVFVGDTMFMPDFGTARTDFPGGSAGELYDSLQAILALPDDTRLFMCHDYKAPGRDFYAWETTVAEQKEKNIHVGDGVSRNDFISMREERDKQLGMPKLILPSIQVNMCAGHLPDPEQNGVRYLKLPIDAV